jgi:hypothetical protein
MTCFYVCSKTLTLLVLFVAYPPPPPGPYRYPVNGKKPVVLGANGMPLYMNPYSMHNEGPHHDTSQPSSPQHGAQLGFMPPHPAYDDPRNHHHHSNLGYHSPTDLGGELQIAE